MEMDPKPLGSGREKFRRKNYSSLLEVMDFSRAVKSMD